MKHITANGIDFAILEEGAGPLILFLHGFPDNAHSWSYQLPTLAKQGYRCIAPFLKGYAPTTHPQPTHFDKAALVADIAALVRKLSPDQPCYLVDRKSTRLNSSH